MTDDTDRDTIHTWTDLKTQHQQAAYCTKQDMPDYIEFAMSGDQNSPVIQISNHFTGAVITTFHSIHAYEHTLLPDVYLLPPHVVTDPVQTAETVYEHGFNQLATNQSELNDYVLTYATRRTQITHDPAHSPYKQH